MAYNHAANLIFWHSAVNHKAEGHQHPWEPRRFEHEKAEEAQHGVWVPSAPDVNECAAEGGAEEGDREERRDEKEGRAGEEQKP